MTETQAPSVTGSFLKNAAGKTLSLARPSSSPQQLIPPHKTPPMSEMAASTTTRTRSQRLEGTADEARRERMLEDVRIVEEGRMA
jgi:hypothetical protein